MNCGPINTLPMFVNAISVNPKTQEKTRNMVNVNQITHIDDSGFDTKIHYITSDDDGNVVGRTGIVRGDSARLFKSLNVKA